MALSIPIPAASLDRFPGRRSSDAAVPGPRCGCRARSPPSPLGRMVFCRVRVHHDTPPPVTNLGDHALVSDHLIAPHGGTLVDLFVDDERAQLPEVRLARLAVARPDAAPDLRPRAAAERRVLAADRLHGARRSRTGLRRDAARGRGPARCGRSRSRSTSRRTSAAQLAPGSSLALRDEEGVMVAALLAVEDVWRPDREAEAEAVFGTANPEHPGVAHLLERHPPLLRGRTRDGHRARHALRLPAAAAFSPAELRAEFGKLGWTKVVAFQTRNPMHRAHQELTLRAAKEAEANLLIHPVVGMTKPGDVDHSHSGCAATRRCCTATRARRRCCRCCRSRCGWAARGRRSGTRSSARTTAARTSSSAATTRGRAATRAARRSTGPTTRRSCSVQHEAELGVTMVPFKMMVYVEDLDSYVPVDEVPEGKRTLNISGTELRQRLADGRDVPGVVHVRRRGLRAAAQPSRRATGRASRSSSPDSPARASRPSRTRCWSSCSSWAGGP